jgi:hypothetical protein
VNHLGLLYNVAIATLYPKLPEEPKTEQATIFSEGFEGYVPDDTDVLTALSPRESSATSVMLCLDPDFNK